MLERQISLSRKIASFIHQNAADFTLLPKGIQEDEIYIIVLFSAKSEKLNEVLVERINRTRKIYVSGTLWEGRSAARFAVASWMVDVERDFGIIGEVLGQVVRESTLDDSSEGTGIR